MKKIKLFALALLATFSLSAMAADKAASGTLNISNVTSENWGTWSKGTPVLDDAGFHITGYMGRNSASQDWIGYLSGNSTSSSPAWSAPAAATHSLGGSAYGTETYFMTMRPTRTMYYRVTGCTGAYALVATQSSGARRVTIKAYEYSANARAAEASKSAISSDSSNDIEEIGFDELDAEKTYEIEIAGTADGNSNYYEICFVPAPNCTAPTAGELTISSDAPAALYEGTEVTISMAGGHGSGRSLTLDGETWMGYPTWTAVAGKHVIRVSEPQWEDTESGVTYCAGEDSVVLNVLAATPVTECTIAGEATGYIGSQITYTATAANATDYEWYVDGVAANTNSATFVYTANALGVHEIKATASNQYTTTPVESNVIDLNVTPLYGELIKAELTSGTAATVTGIVGGTADVSLSSSKKMDNGKYFGITLASGSFLEGDTVVIVMTKAGGNYPCLFADKDRTNCLFLAAEGSSELEYRIELPAAATGLTSLYLSRNDDENYKWNPTLTSIAVIRPLDDGSPVLKASQTAIELAVTADNPNPSVVVNFSGKHLTPGSYSFGGGAVQNLVINPTSVTVDADGKLNQDVTFSYSNDADVAPYATIKNLTVDCEGGSKNVQVTITMSASHAIEYSSSINIEDSILDYGTKYGIAAALAAAKIQYENIDALDSLNDQKADRNEPFLGLKLKKSGANIKVAVEAGKVLNVRFGNHTAMINVSINGTPIDGGVLVGINDYSLEASTEDRIVTFSTSSDATVVIKQIMVGEDLVDVLLPTQVMFVVNCVKPENGKLSATWEGKGSKDIAAAEGTIITLTVTPDDGFEIDQITAGNEVIVPVEGVYSYTFTMIGQNIDVIATFKAGATALDEAEEAVKAHKVVRDGHIVIIRGEKEFNAQGAQLR